MGVTTAMKNGEHGKRCSYVGKSLGGEWEWEWEQEEDLIAGERKQRGAAAVM